MEDEITPFFPGLLLLLVFFPIMLHSLDDMLLISRNFEREDYVVNLMIRQSKFTARKGGRPFSSQG